MSKYHPLDVRHPSNRDLLRRHYLLDPPAPHGPGAGGQSVPARTVAQSALSENRRRQPAAPWGRREASPTTVAAPATTRRVGGFWWNAFIIGVFVVIFASQNGMLAGLLDTLRAMARQNGIALPF